MGSSRKQTEDPGLPSRPATSREGRQTQLEAMALDLAEKQMKSGDVSSQVLSHFLKSASTRGRIEELRLKHEIELMKAKKHELESREELQKMFTEAMQAMSGYRMDNPEEDQRDPYAQ